MDTQYVARVLVVDDDVEVVSNLKEILEPLGYRVEAPEGFGDILANNAISLAFRFRPHVAVVDLSFIPDNASDRGGLRLLRHLESTSCIIFSRNLKNDLTREIHKEYPSCVWVDKVTDSPGVLVEAVAEAAKERCGGLRELPIYRPQAWMAERISRSLFPDRPDLPPDIVDDVLAQLFPGSRQLTLEAVSGEVVSAPVISRSGSIVLRVHPDDRLPVVVELGPAERIRREHKNYHALVKIPLEDKSHAELGERTEFWDLGGAVYRLRGAPQGPLRSYTAFYQQETDAEAIMQPLRHFFTEVWRRPYAHPQDIGRPLFHLYDSSLELKQLMERFGPRRRIKFPGLPHFPIQPVQWVLTYADNSSIRGANQAVTQGDLHGDYIFVDGRHAWAIGYEHAGSGHILRDFVALEIDVVTRLLPAPETDFSRFYELAIVLATPAQPDVELVPTPGLQSDAAWAKAVQVVAGIRALAHDVTSYGDSREYLWGLLLHALFVGLTAPSRAPERNRALLLATVLCARLRDWGGAWPPPDFPSVPSASRQPREPNRRAAPSKSRTNHSPSTAGYDVFLSYPRSEQKAVKQVAQQLREAGIEPWMDQWNLPAGRPFRKEIEAAIAECRAFVAFWGSAGFGDWQIAEIDVALERQLRNKDYPLIPVLLPGSLDPVAGGMSKFIAQGTWVDFRAGLDDPLAFRRLVEGIRGMPPGPEEP